MKNILMVVGARPNFIKIAPLCRAADATGLRYTLVHTGQHYDANMSEVFFRELEIPAPHGHLGVGPGDRQMQTHAIVQGLLPTISDKKPDAVLVVGDVTSSAAGAMAGCVAGVPVVHVEAGLRSFDWRMPEELNRMIADHYSRWLFVSEPSGIANLRAEAIPEECVVFAGNVMVDTLLCMKSRAENVSIHERFGCNAHAYGVITLHRPETVDHPERLRAMCECISQIAQDTPCVFPMHPRTRERFDAAGIRLADAVRVIEPVGYVDMLALVMRSVFVLTDSGGLQEETTMLGVPCLTARENTERPITVTSGTSECVGTDPERIMEAYARIRTGSWKHGSIPALWDGRAAERIVEHLIRA